jgi:hypothetical protein
MCPLTYFVYLILLLLMSISLLWQIFVGSSLWKNRGCFDSIQIFDPLYPNDRVYNFNEIEPVILKSSM